MERKNAKNIENAVWGGRLRVLIVCANRPGANLSSEGDLFATTRVFVRGLGPSGSRPSRSKIERGGRFTHAHPGTNLGSDGVLSVITRVPVLRLVPNYSHPSRNKFGLGLRFVCNYSRTSIAIGPELLTPIPEQMWARMTFCL